MGLADPWAPDQVGLARIASSGVDPHPAMIRQRPGLGHHKHRAKEGPSADEYRQAGYNPATHGPKTNRPEQAMTRRTFIFALAATAMMLVTGASPALAARLTSVEAEAQDEQITNEGLFRLGAQTSVELSFNATVRNGGQVEVRVYQKLPNGRWQRINTPVSTARSQRGKREMTLHAGEYKVEVVATNAQVSVTVDN